MRADETLFKGINVYFNRLWGKRGRNPRRRLLSLRRKEIYFYFYITFLIRGTVENGKGGKKSSEAGPCRAIPRQTFNSSRKWIKLIKLVCNLHGPSNTPATDTHRD